MPIRARESNRSIAHKYTGAPFPWRDPEGRVVLAVEADTIRQTRLPFKHTPPV